LLIEAAKDRIRDYFKGRAAEKQQGQIREWEAEGAYPDFGDQRTPVLVAERQAFDIVALSAASVVDEGTPRSRRLALNLIKTALESGPTALQGCAAQRPWAASGQGPRAADTAGPDHAGQRDRGVEAGR
jgi:hypothetical protein